MQKSEIYKFFKHEKVITLENNNEKKNIELRVNKLDIFQDDSYILLLRDITEENKLMEIQKLLDEKKHDEQVKTEILANISHEFKTPVNVIYAAVQMQDLEKDRGNYNEINKYNKTIKQNCYRLIRLINNFIDSTKYKDKDITIPFTPFNIVNLVEETSLSVLSYVESKNINLVFDTNEELIVINGNKQLMERVILNILSNAIKYNKENGFINVNIYGEKDKVQIIISDSGIGIPEEKIDMIFNRFERIDKSFSRNNEGSGLGLNIVYEIIKKHNGTIKASSKENFGTTITITLNRIYTDEEFLENTNEISDINYNLELEMSDIYM